MYEYFVISVYIVGTTEYLYKLFVFVYVMNELYTTIKRNTACSPLLEHTITQTHAVYRRDFGLIEIRNGLYDV